MKYRVTAELSIPVLANPRHKDLSLTEVKNGYRTIGGDKGDIMFNGFTLDEENNKTILDDPILSTTIEDLTEDEVNNIAVEIVQFSFESLGAESVE